MEVPIQGLLFVGIIPALILLFIGLKGYEGYYRDRSIFLIFVIGIIFGVIAAVLRLYLNPPPLLIVYIILFAFFEQLLKTVVLNIGRLQNKRETTIYGLAMGLGFGSSFTPFLVIVGSLSGHSDLYFLSLVILGSFGFILFHSATGALIGYGIYSGKMTKYLLTAIILQLPFNGISDLTRFYLNPRFALYQAGLVIYGAILFAYVIIKVMPRILKEDKSKKKNKK